MIDVKVDNQSVCDILDSLLFGLESQIACWMLFQRTGRASEERMGISML